MKSAKDFLVVLGAFKMTIPRQSFKTLRGQALSGDTQGAMKGLAKIILEIKN